MRVGTTGGVGPYACPPQVTGGIILGTFLLGEIPSVTAIIGVGVTLVGIAGVLV